jgi:hypothetical protein
LTDEELIREVEAQRELMISVATGGPQIKSVDAEYRERRDRIARALRNRHLDDPNPYSDLWRWYAYWSSKLAGYAARRAYIAEMYDPLIDEVYRRDAVQVFDDATGWERVDRVVDKARADLRAAVDEEDFQTIGLNCREILISVAQAVHDNERHPPVGDRTPSDTDAARRIEAYIAAVLVGASEAEARTAVKKILALAVAVQHRRTAGFRDAALCLEATVAVVNMIAVLDGRRGPA